MIRKGGYFMELKEAILTRRSVRGYTGQGVSRETIREILQTASRAVSAENYQPWEFIVAAGEPLEKLREYNINALKSGQQPDREFKSSPDIKFLNRSRTIGKALLGAMGIAREDKEGRAWWAQRGFRFFDAPVAIFLLMDARLSDDYLFDLGCVTQNILLAAHDQGLATCVEAQAIIFEKGIREILGIPEGKRIVTGISIGYEDPSFAANAVISPRENIDDITEWFGL